MANQPTKEELRKRYEDKIAKQFSNELSAEDFSNDSDSFVSSEYMQFKKDNQALHRNIYESVCGFCEKVAPIKPDKTKAPQLERDIEDAHLQMSATGATSFALLIPLSVIMLGSMILYLLTQDMFMMFIAVIGGALLIIPLQTLPSYIAQSWRMRASNQMILGVFYIATYMRHTSNLERAIEFASQHLQAPLSLDLRKIIWDVETKRFDSIFESVEYYLSKWKDYNPEFVESMHVIMSSLYEGSEDKRQELLDKSLDLILEETYDKMLHYAHNLQSPITALHMLGIVLPILGMIILPLVINFMPEIKWYYIAIMYNLFLPVVIYIMGKQILAKRPSGYGGVEVNMDNPEIKRRDVKEVPLFGGVKIPLVAVAILLIILGFVLGFLPMIMHAVGASDIGMGDSDDSSVCGHVYCLMEYKVSQEDAAVDVGPFGLGATLLSLAIPLGVILAIGFYYQTRYKQLVKMREDTENLEAEFVGALFQLGNRLGDGIPPEMAFPRVAQSMPNTKSGQFFQLISTNIQKLGMGLEEAIFNPKNGALVYFPSGLIESSMKILTQSAAKGPYVASKAISNVARYIREMNRVNQRLQDLMAEVIASMKSQISFLTPIILGIVIGITSMITSILSKLAAITQMDNAELSAEVANYNTFLSSFGDGVPPFYFSLIISIYVIEVIYLLTLVIVGIQKGVDPIYKKHLIGKNFIKSGVLYIAVSFIIILVFNIIAGSILGSVV